MSNVLDLEFWEFMSTIFFLLWNRLHNTWPLAHPSPHVVFFPCETWSKYFKMQLVVDFSTVFCVHKGLFINDVINFGGYPDPPSPPPCNFMKTLYYNWTNSSNSDCRKVFCVCVHLRRSGFSIQMSKWATHSTKVFFLHKNEIPLNRILVSAWNSPGTQQTYN